MPNQKEKVPCSEPLCPNFWDFSVYPAEERPTTWYCPTHACPECWGGMRCILMPKHRGSHESRTHRWDGGPALREELQSEASLMREVEELKQTLAERDAQIVSLQADNSKYVEQRQQLARQLEVTQKRLVYMLDRLIRESERADKLEKRYHEVTFEAVNVQNIK